MFTVYIIHSLSIDRHYIGYTSLTIEHRLKKHFTNHKGFTANAQDWSVIFTQSFHLKSDAISLEKKIKKRGAARFLDGLIN